jgi:hypothetical protein
MMLKHSYRISVYRIGRVERQIRRAFIASDGRPLLTIDLMRWVFPRVSHYEAWRYWSVHRAATKCAVKVGRCGKGNLWQPNNQLLARIKGVG